MTPFPIPPSPGEPPPPLPPPPPPPPGGWPRWLPPPRRHITVPMRIVGIAQVLICVLLALGAGFALLALALAALIAGPFVGVIFEAVGGPLVVAAALIAVHFTIAVAIVAMRRWGIVLLVVVSMIYVLACVLGILEGRSASEDALRSRIVLSLILWAMLALLNTLACSQWRHAR